MSENTQQHSTTDIDRLVAWMEAAPDPAPEVIALERRHVERLLDLLENNQTMPDPTDELFAVLRGALAEPKQELWAIHSVGPGEVYPSLSRENAEKEAAELRACVLKSTGIDPTVTVIASPWEPAEHFEILAEEVTEHRNNLLEYVRELEEKPSDVPE